MSHKSSQSSHAPHAYARPSRGRARASMATASTDTGNTGAPEHLDDEAPSDSHAARIRLVREPRKWPAWMREPVGEPDRIPAAPGAIMGKAFRDNWKILAAYSLVSCLSYVALALLPWTVGSMLDSGIQAGLTRAILPGVLWYSGLVLYLCLMGMADLCAVMLWMRSAWSPARRLTRVVFGRRTDVGRDVPSGDIVAAITQDPDRLGALIAFVPEAIGSSVAFVVVTALMLRTSAPLGLFVAVGMPLVMALVSWIIRPLQKRLAEQREEQGILTSLATDGVAGLRVMRGVGGEDVYNERYRAQSLKVQEAGIRAARFRAALHTVENAGPALFAAAVVGGGLWMAYTGRMTVGELVTFYGFTAYLEMPLSALSETVHNGTRAWVGVKKLSRILSADYLVSDAAVDPALPRRDWAATALTDAATGVRVEPGRLTALVSASPAETAGIASRIARVDDAHTAYADDIDLRAYPVAEVRANVLLSGPVAELYMGSLRSNLMGPNARPLEPRTVRDQVADVLALGGEFQEAMAEPAGPYPADPRLLRALDVADGCDVVSSVVGGLDGWVAERGRSLSGGQRQRVALARALAVDPAVLVLVEPTSAVDSHTEARIAGRLAAFRRGRTSVVVTGSPLVLAVCDEVVFVVGGVPVLRGSHRQLLADPAYQATVHRGEGA